MALLPEHVAGVGTVDRLGHEPEVEGRRLFGLDLVLADREDAQVRRGAGEKRRHAPVAPCMAVAGDDDDRAARLGVGGKGRAGKPGVAQALRLDHAGQKVLGQRVAMRRALFVDAGGPFGFRVVGIAAEVPCPCPEED